MRLERDIVEMLRAGGAGPVGFADLTAPPALLPAQVRHDLPRAVAFAVALDAGVVAGITEGPTRKYVAEYARVNELLDRLGEQAAKLLEGRGYAAVCSPATSDDYDDGTKSTPLPHKTVATLAGLGWIGKCALLVTDEYGAAVRLSRVLTDAPLPVAEPVTVSRCGACRACADVCPGSAVTGREWTPGRPRASIFDAVACDRAMDEIGSRVVGADETLCGMCIAACPYTREWLARGRADA